MRDNVCIAARDIDGDGKVEVAVGTNWNPGETSDSEKSGGVWFVGSLGNIQPKKLPHDPTTHRMYWVKMEAGYSIVVAPLHGRGNKGGVGENGTRIQVYYAGNDHTRLPGSEAWSMTNCTKRTTSIYSKDLVILAKVWLLQETKVWFWPVKLTENGNPGKANRSRMERVKSDWAS